MQKRSIPNNRLSDISAAPQKRVKESQAGGAENRKINRNL
jgi:hypothetical protein